MRIDINDYSSDGDRSENEDSQKHMQLTDRSGYAVVADGLGAHGGGARASRIAVDALSKFYAGDPLPSAEQIRQWMEEANREILQQWVGACHMKTTAVALYFADNQAIWAHTGDSRLYHFYNGELCDATEDQSVCQLLVLQGELTRAQIPESPDKNKLIYALGNEEIRPIIHEAVVLKPGMHTFLLCTDGLWERLREEELGLELNTVRRVADGSMTPGAKWLSNLRIRADLRRHENVDNNTAVVVDIGV